MLIERVFEIGGGLCVALGVLLLFGLAAFGPNLVGLGLSGTLCLGFGALLFWVGSGARRERLELLHLGEAGAVNGPKRPPAR